MLIKHTRVPLSCDTIWSIHPRCWTQGLSTSSSAYTIYSSCSTTTPTHSCSAGYFETDWWRPRKGGSAPNYLCMFCLLFYYPSKIIVVQQYRGRDIRWSFAYQVKKNVESSLLGCFALFKLCSRRFLRCDFSFFFLHLKATRSHENFSLLNDKWSYVLTVQILYVEIQTLRIIILYLNINVAREYLGLFMTVL